MRSASLEQMMAKRTPGWEAALLAQALKDEMEAAADFYDSVQWPLDAPQGSRFSVEETLAAVENFVSELKAWAVSIMPVLSEEAMVAFGAPGGDGDPQQIRKVAWKLGNYVNALVTWEQNVASTPFHIEWQEVKQILSGCTTDLYYAVENWRDELASVPARAAAGEDSFDLVLTLPPSRRIEELPRIAKHAIRRSVPFWKRRPLMTGLLAGIALDSLLNE